MINMAKLFEAGGRAVIDEFKLEWNCYRMGARIEYWDHPIMPTTGSKVYENFPDIELHNSIHLSLMNRGVIIVTFHDMASMRPKTSEADIDKFTNAFRAVITKIV